jgi:hypothetical protein
MNGYTDIGANNASHGAFCKIGIISAYQYKFIEAKTGLLWTFPVTKGNGFAAWFISGKGDFHIKKAKFEGGLFYRHIPFSNLLREHNWGLWLGFNSKHFCMKLGNNFHTFKFTAKGQEELGLTEEDDIKISEPRNLMYDFRFFIKPYDHKWNVVISITDFDHFLIQQETNPMVMAGYKHRILENEKWDLEIYDELWYQSSGLLNLQVNFFGVYNRLGVLWKLK